MNILQRSDFSFDFQNTYKLGVLTVTLRHIRMSKVTACFCFTLTKLLANAFKHNMRRYFILLKIIDFTLLKGKLRYMKHKHGKIYWFRNP